MKWPTLKCPFCPGILRNTDVYPGRPVVCPSCGAKLQPPTNRGRLLALVGLCLTVAICYLGGVSSEWFLVAVVLLWFPIYVISGFVFGRIVPPRFEAFDPQTGHLPKKLISLDLDDRYSAQAPEPGDSQDSGNRPAADSRTKEKQG
jgi:hypothetical protein